MFKIRAEEGKGFREKDELSPKTQRRVHVRGREWPAMVEMLLRHQAKCGSESTYPLNLVADGSLEA